MDSAFPFPTAARYFDNAATTPMDPRVLQEMLPFLGEAFGNANSIHSFGQRAYSAVELARRRVAALIGAEDPSQILFVSGATEANNQVLRSFATGSISPFEHSAVREPALALGLSVLENDGYQILKPTERQELISVMAINNETGTMWDPAEFRDCADFIHSDLTQAVGKVPINLEEVDFASFSAHKFYGPKGVGALYFRDIPPKPYQLGGEQELGLRGGTTNVAGIVGMGVAAKISAEEQEQNFGYTAQLRSVFLDALSDCMDWRINGGDSVLPSILSISFLGVEGETLVIEADRAGYAISSGAACSSHSKEPSHVLEALKISEDWARGTVRVSFGKYCTFEAARSLAVTLRQTIEKLRTLN